MEGGLNMIITIGARPEVLYDIAEGKEAGTLFIGRNQA
jgi:glutamate 5-kinase